MEKKRKKANEEEVKKKTGTNTGGDGTRLKSVLSTVTWDRMRVHLTKIVQDMKGDAIHWSVYWALTCAVTLLTRRVY